MRDKFLLWYDKHYYKILALTGLIIYLIDWKLFWYIFIPGAIWFRITAGLLTNYYLSYFGYTNYDLGTDTAKNSFLVNIFTFGEGWHNNHHAQPGNYRIGHKWWEWDPTAFIITHFLKK
jgi:stearoyl-CoA desaturase (delta-9 desaturase)